MAGARSAFGGVARAALLLGVSSLAAAQSDFEELSLALGLDSGALAQGCAWGDYDGDGMPDLFVSNNDAILFGSACKLFHNDGASGFTDQAPARGVDDGGPAFGAAWADFDNDGDLDLYLVRGAIPFLTGDHFLFRNDGAVASWPAYQAPVRSQTGRSVAWADYDNDGLVDLYVTDGPSIPLVSSPSPSLLRNRGDGTFEDVSARAGIVDTIAGQGAAWGDYDGDGWPDLFVVNYGVPDAPVPLYAPNLMYHNKRDGTFEEVGQALGVRGDEDGLRRGCFGAAWADYDADGWLDLYVTCGFDNLAVVTTGFGTTNLMYHNEAGSGFRELGVRTATADPEGSFGCAWGDHDNDGAIDLYVANGLALQTQPSNRLFRNFPQLGLFVDVGGTVGVDSPNFSQAAAWGDYDRDGWLDLYVVETEAQDKLYHNKATASGHWLELSLEGVRANRSAIGAAVLARTPGKTQKRVINSGSGYLSSDDLVVHFGLGSATSAEVEIQWPGPDFCVQDLGSVAADQFLMVRERCAAPANVLRAPHRLPLSAVFPLPIYLPLPATAPFTDPDPVLGGPDALLFYQVEAPTPALLLVKAGPSLALYY